MVQKSLRAYFFNFRFQRFSKNMFNSLCPGRIFFGGGSHLYIFFVIIKFLINLIFLLNSLRSLFNSPRLLFGVEQNFKLNFTKLICFLSNFYVDRLIILGFMLLVLLDM